MTQKPIKIILNPYAGRWKAKTYIEPLKEAFTRLGLDYDLVVTKAAGEGITIARQAAETGFEIVVAAGGDSTVGEVINGLVQAAGEGQAGTLGIIPLGTANDLADMLQIPRNLAGACQKIAAGKTRIIDVGQVNHHFFGNNSAVGLEPVVTVEAEKIKRISGSLRYIVAALRAVAKRPVWHAHLVWDHGSYKGPISLVSIGNSPRTGGAFWMTPTALLDDGKLDVVFAPSLSRFSLLRLLPMTFSGKHVHHQAVTSLQVTTLQITMDPTPLQADGEILDRQATQINYRIFPKKLRVIV
jgi:diacylglycerol kinase (ATP)